MGWFDAVTGGLNAAGNFSQNPLGGFIFGGAGGYLGGESERARGRNTSSGSGTSNTSSTSTNIFDPSGLETYRGLQPQGAAAVSDYLRDPFTAGYFSRQQQRLNENIAQQGRTARQGLLSQVGQMGPGGVSGLSPFLASEFGRINRSTQRSQASGLTDLLGQAEQLRRGAAETALNYRPLQTGTSSTAEGRTSFEQETERGSPPAWQNILTGGLGSIGTGGGPQQTINTALNNPLVNSILGGGGAAGGGLPAVPSGLNAVAPTLGIGMTAAPAAFGLAGAAPIAAQVGGVAAGTGALTGTGVASGLAAPGAAGGAGGLGGLLGGLASNPLTWAGAAGLGGALLAKKYVGRGRRTADAIVPTQENVDAQLRDLTDNFWQQHAGGNNPNFGAQDVQQYLNQLEEIRNNFGNFLGSGNLGPNDPRAINQATNDIGGLISQLQNNTRNNFLPYYPELGG